MINLSTMSRLKVLLVEKDSLLRDELVNEFIREGSSIIAVESAREAVQCLNEECFDVVIGDFVSAEAENLKLVKLADRHYPNSIRIAIVANGSLDECPDLQKCAVDDIIRKPFPFVSLLYTISQRMELKGLDCTSGALAAN